MLSYIFIKLCAREDNEVKIHNGNSKRIDGFNTDSIMNIFYNDMLRNQLKRRKMLKAICFLRYFEQEQIHFGKSN